MKYIIYLCLCVTLYTSCRREGFSTIPLASIKIINTVAGGMPVKFRGVPTTTINNNSNGNFGLLPGSQDLYIYPVADSLHPYYHGNNKVVMEAQQSYSLFLGGTPDAITPLLIHENWVMNLDGNIRVRFLNFSPGSPSVNVTLSTSSGINEFSNIPFGQITDFKAYTKIGINPSYRFEVRNAITNNLITAFTLSAANVAGFNHVTLVFRGIVGGTPAPGISSIIHN